MNFNDELKKFGLVKYESEADDREPIDFSISDATDNVAWVYGSEPWNDVSVECNHPSEAIEWGDDDERGECLLCGAQCLWHWEKREEYEGTDDDGYIVSSKYESRVIDEWLDYGKKGLIGKYLKELQKTF